MVQHAAVALGRNLGVDLGCATLDDPAALDLDNVDSRKKTSRATSARESKGGVVVAKPLFLQIFSKKNIENRQKKSDFSNTEF